MDEIHSQGETITARTEEGVAISVPVADFVQALAPPRADTAGLILPDGVKAAFSRGPMLILLHVQPPSIQSLRWIADNSPAPYGPEAVYRTVRIALPYVCILAAYSRERGGPLTLVPRCECFFRNEPVRSVEDELCYPALLNCSKFRTESGRPLSWICTQHLDFGSLRRVADEGRRIARGLVLLLQCMYGAAYNLSSEKHEGMSWFTESVRANIDPRIATVERWEEATRSDPLFALSVPWLKTGRSIKAIAERIFGLARIPSPKFSSSADLARVVLNQAAAANKPSPQPTLHLAVDLPPEPEPEPELEPQMELEL